MPESDAKAATLQPRGEILIETAAPPKPSSDNFHPIASLWHTGLVLAVIGLSAFRGWARAGQMRASIHPDRITIYQRTILFELLVLGLVLAGVWLSGSPLRAILGDRWRSAGQFLRDLGIGLVFLVVTIVVSSVVGSHGGGEDSATQFLLPQGRIELVLWVALSITAGICEEAVYRGYLQKQFMALTRNVPAGIILSALVFGGAHSYQGLAHASVIGSLGALTGVLAYWCRSVRPGMIAHTLQDVLGGFIRH
jgi:membrane protease YdiL (CAAX protease family)